jgi:hypothetical protein
MPAAIAIPAIIGAVGSIGGAAIAAHGAGKQAGAAMSAADLQHQDAQDALNFQKQEFNTQQANQAPFLKAGQGAVTSLSSMLQNGQFAPWQGSFNAPTNVTEQNDPGYQFRLDQGLKALQNSAAAKGNLLSGGTAKGMDQFAQNDASQEYGNVYDRAFQQYQQKYGEFQQGQANTFNRYASLAGLGQQAVGQLGAEGQGAASNASNILLGSGAQIGQDIQSAAAAQAGGSNAFANAFSGIGNQAASIPYQIQLRQLLAQNNNNSGYGSVKDDSTQPWQ